MHPVRVRVNGVEYEEYVQARQLLSDFLRETLGLTGTHVGCEHGVCGACTVLLDGQPVRSCLMLAVQASGSTILTVEGLADGDQLHPLQEAFRDHHALQCGFCTPGMLMVAHYLITQKPELTRDEVVEGLSGNLCRCTGYLHIIDAVLSAASITCDGVASR